MTNDRTSAMPPTTITQLVGDVAAEHGDSAIWEGVRCLPYARLPHQTARLAGGLRALGIQPGDHVAIWMTNRVEWLLSWFAVAWLGATLVPLNTRFTVAEADYVMRQSRVRWLVREHGVGNLDAEAVTTLVTDGLDLRGHIVVDGPPASDTAPFASVLDGQALPSYESVEQVGMIQYTSGSTSFPKGAMLRNAALIRNGHGLGTAWQMTPVDRVLAVNPLFHCGGTVFALMAGFAHGASVELLRRWRVQEAASLIANRRVTVFPAIETIVRDLLALVRSAGQPLPTLRLVATPSDRALLEQVVAVLGCEVSNVYGLTEASPNVCVGDLSDPLDTRLEYVGRPQLGLEVSIRDPSTGGPRAPATIGEITVRGWAVMTGYFDDTEHTASVFTDDGFLRTGDLGSITDDGYLRFLGRRKLMIKSGGENVSIEEVERCVRAHPQVDDAVVVPVADERFGEVGFGFVRPMPGGTLDLDALVQHCRSLIAGFKVPKHFEVVEAFPLVGSHKVDRRQLTERAEQTLRERVG
jgi:fatty-acyl-CoA synthase